MAYRKSFWRKIFSGVTIFSLLLNSVLPYGLASTAYAQESSTSATQQLADPTPTDTPVLVPTETPASSPADTPSPTPTDVLDPTPTDVPTPTPVLDLTPTATPSATPEPGPTNTPETTPEATPSATPEPGPEASPSATPADSLDSNAEYERLGQEKIPLRNDGDFLKNSIQQTHKDYIEGEVIVKFKRNNIDIREIFGKARSYVFEKKFSLNKTDDIPSSNIQVFKSKRSTEELLRDLNTDPDVEYVEPNYKRYTTSIITNDTFKNLLWGLDNTGQTVNGTAGLNDADIDAPEAWTVSESGSNVVVAVIDTGVAYNHPDLLANMWDGSNCKNESGSILGGCNHGYDYENNDKTPLPDNSSHGTHVAGTIAAIKNNAKGIIGVAPMTKVMAIKFNLTVASEVKAIDFAVQNGAKIINASFGGGTYSQSEFEAINRFKNAGGIFVAAAGNDARNNENTHNYPSDYNLDNIISVAATDQNDTLASFSNFGSASVDVGAPGVNIYSTIPDIRTTQVLNETFESLIPPSIPAGWNKTGDWGTYNLGGTNKVLYGDVHNIPYAKNANSSTTTSSYNLTDSTGTTVDFWSRCDTANDDGDYMAVEIGEGGTYQELGRWNEYAATLSYDYVSSISGFTTFHFIESIPSQYAGSNTTLRFRWQTDNDNFVSDDGCLIDDVIITKYSNGSNELYDFMNGTSMAAPHVAGLAALIEGYNPNLTIAQVKDRILTSGDSISALSGKTVSGKRINAQKALQSANSFKAITAFTIPNQVGSTVINEANHTIGVAVPFGTNVTSLIPTITITGVSVSPASGIANNFTTPRTYTVTAADSSTQAYIVTVTIGADPIATAFDEISATLASAPNYIANNLSDVTSANVGNFSGLFLEKSINAVPVGKLLFTGTLDLSSSQTRTFLQNFSTKIELSEGRIALDARDSTIFTSAGATLVMYDLPAGVTSTQLIVRDDSDIIVDPSTIISGFTQNSSTGDISFHTAHFTQFDIDLVPPVITSHANIGPIEATSPSGAIVTYIAPNATDNIDPTAPASCNPVSASTFSLGPNTVTCNKTDTAGNIATPTTFTVTVSDTSSPSAPSAPITLSPTNDTTPTWTWTGASDIVGVDHYIFYWDTVSGGETNASESLSSATSSFTHTTLLTTGTWYGKVRAFDASGNDTVSAVGSVVIDADAPVGSISINGGSAFANNNTVTLNFSGVSSDVTTMELGNGVSGSYQSSITYENPHTYTLPSNGDGTYTVRVRFTDALGNKNTGTISDAIDLDKTNPTDPTDIYSTSHTATPSTTKTIDMAWTVAGTAPGATDAGSGIDGYSYAFTQGASDVPDTTKDAEETAISTSSNVLIDGSWYFHLRTRDNAGNWTSTVHKGPFIVDTTKPVIASHENITALATSASGAVVTYTAPLATDNVDATALASCTPISGSVFPIGVTTVNCTKTDSAGNSATPTFFTVTVMKNPPTLAPIGNKAVDELATLTFTATATDPDSAVITYSLTDAPTGATINETTGVFSFTPTESQGPGVYILTVNATDPDNNTDSEEITITVNEVNVAPTANDVSVSTNEDTTKNITLSATDTDLPAQGINYFLVTNPTHGTLDAISDGKVNYTPFANYNGSDSFTYKANDGVTDSNTATVSISVNPINDAPVASDNTVSVDEDSILTIAKTALLANDTDVDGDSLSLTAVSNPVHGSVSIVGDNVVFTPTTNYSGSASFDYTVSDGTLTDTGTVAVTVNAVNDAPTFDPIANQSINEDSSSQNVSITNISSGPSDEVGQSVALSATSSNPAIIPNPSITGSGSTRTLTYAPSANTYGSATITVTANDGQTSNNIYSRTFTVTVNSVNDTPIALDDTATVDEDATLTIAKSVLLTNDTDVDGDSLTLTAVSNPINGSVTIEGDNVVFTPTANYSGPASFDYTVSDGILTDTGTVTVTVNAVNDAPIASDSSVLTSEETPVTISLLGADADGNTLAYSIVDNPTHGTLNTISGNQVIYTPSINYTGPDSFTFKTNDGALDSNLATVSITVSEYNDPPVLDPIGNKSINELATLTFTATVTDPDSTTITFSLTDAPSGATINETTGVFSFTPTEAQGPGIYTLTVNATDGTSTDSEEITITVNEVNVAPTANDVSVSTNEDTTKNITLSATDTDLPAQGINYFLVTNPTHGTLDAISDGKVNYTPSANYNGLDSFTYKANDGVIDSNTAKVSISVNPINDAPVASDNTVSVDEDSILTIAKTALLANDTDVDGDSLTLTAVLNPVHGSVSIVGDNVVFTPTTNYSGSASFDYTVSDGILTDTGTVTITVNAVNDAPTVDAQTVTTEEDTPITITLVASDVDGDSLTYSIVSDVNQGTLGEITDNHISYMPNPNYTGLDSFEFIVNDGQVDSSPALVSITVTPFNDQPVLGSIGNQSINESEELTFTANADDPEGLPLTYSLNGGPVGATIDSSTGVFSWIPTESQGPGEYTFSVIVSDGTKTDSEEITVTVNEVNVAPVASDVSVSTLEDTTKNMTLSASDSDLPAQEINYSLVANPLHGTLDAIIDGKINYTPSANYNGLDSFTYKANDGVTDSNIATVNITVTAANDPPVLTAIGNRSVNELETLSFTATANDPDNSLTYSLTDAPTGATINSTTGVFSFTPTEAQGPGTYALTVHATDGTSTDSEEITITVNEVNVAPTANDVSVSTPEDTTKNITLSATDTDLPAQGINYSLVSNPTHGTLDAINDGKINYTPAVNYYGTDAFTYKANDGSLDSNTATVTITVVSVNDKPVATDSAVSTGENVSKVVTFSTTDSDVPIQSLTYAIVANPSHGTLSVISGNQVTYTPNAGYSGTDSFTFKANDGTDDSNTATVTVTVIANPDAPVITSVATDNIINNAEKSAIHVIGTAEVNSFVTVTITDGTNTKTGTQQLAGGAASYDITLDGTTALPASLADGAITVSATATNSVEGVSVNATTAVVQDTVAPTVTKLGNDSADVTIAVAGTVTLTFNEPLSTSGKAAVANALTAGADQMITFGWNDTNDTLTIAGHATNTTTFANDVVVNTSDVAGNTATGLLIVDSSLTATQTIPDGDTGSATINSITPQVVITNPTQAVTVTITNGTPDPTIDVSSFITNGTGTLPQISINSDNATISIPSATTVTSSDPAWNGIISAPTVTTVTLPDTAGETEMLGTAIEIGFADAKLSFGNAVRILLPGQAGKRAGYSRPGTTFTEITSTCSADSQAAGDALGADSECKIDVGSDLVIWTKHFTIFAAYSTTSSGEEGSEGNGDAGGGGGGGTGDGLSDGLSGQAPVCNDTKPASTPTLLSVVAGTNSVTLTWSQASAPVSYYLVTYGTGPGLQQFGNPNVGPSGTTSYTINGLSGGSIYYFRVRAGNGCKPGDFSNELSAGPGGGFIEGPASGFEPGVLGTKTEESVQATEMAPDGTKTAGKALKSQTSWSWWLYLGGFGSATIVGILKIIGLL